MSYRIKKNPNYKPDPLHDTEMRGTGRPGTRVGHLSPKQLEDEEFDEPNTNAEEEDWKE